MRHKRLRKQLFIARNDLHFERQDSTKLKHMVKNPLGTGIPNSLPTYD